MSNKLPVYATYAEFYQAEYGAYLRRMVSRGPMTLIDASQTAGDFSDAATGDLMILRLRSRVRAHTDFSAGKRSSWHAPGEFFVNPAGFANSILVDQPHRVDGACIRWADLLALDVDGRLPKDGSFGAVHERGTLDPAMASILDHLWSIEDDDASALPWEAAMIGIGQRLVDWMTWPAATVRRSVEKLSPRSLTLSKERLESTGTEAPTLSELAALCRLSPHHFCRAFKAATGLPPHRYQIVARIERARAMLTDSRLSVAEVGSAVGYDDPAYFSRLFTRETGVSPRGWRQQMCQ